MFWFFVIGTILLLLPAFSICDLSRQLIETKRELDSTKRELEALKKH